MSVLNEPDMAVAPAIRAQVEPTERDYEEWSLRYEIEIFAARYGWAAIMEIVADLKAGGAQ